MLEKVHNSSCSVKLKRHVLGYYPWWVERWVSYQRSMISESDELWDVVWAELDPDLGKIGFRNKLSTHVQEVLGMGNAMLIIPNPMMFGSAPGGVNANFMEAVSGEIIGSLD
jgi:hypothetical protein